jgi:branched-subunit amino acid transport protein
MAFTPIGERRIMLSYSTLVILFSLVLPALLMEIVGSDIVRHEIDGASLWYSRIVGWAMVFGAACYLSMVLGITISLVLKVGS